MYRSFKPSASRPITLAARSGAVFTVTSLNGPFGLCTPFVPDVTILIVNEQNHSMRLKEEAESRPILNDFCIIKLLLYRYVFGTLAYVSIARARLRHVLASYMQSCWIGSNRLWTSAIGRLRCA